MYLLHPAENSVSLKNRLQGTYQPHRGYIGTKELRVPNYLFGAPQPPDSLGGYSLSGYAHCRRVVNHLLSQPIDLQYQKSRDLTQFLRRRELTFSKKIKNGEYRIFTVPCTTTPVPVSKSTFDQMERSAQVLVASLRLVMQDIYGSESVRQSSFVQSLPKDSRKIFISAVERSPHYFPQLHHPAMKDYPFFDVVGLDLVLTEDYPDTQSKGPRLVAKASPFRLLEINAGSPSGASNNLTILEGLTEIDPEGVKALGKVMPNDHFKVLAQTYKSLGESWTQKPEGVQVILPPGGTNGATPEIHQLAANSGLIYCDAGQLYRDTDGYIRIRTVSGKDPIVNAIYSRVNSDSALYNPERKLTLKDAETGKPLYLTDPLESNFRKNARLVRDSRGNPIPLESSYTIPGAIEAIHARKLYMGGLNRILDNKIILDSLCRFAQIHFRKDLLKMGLDSDGVTPILPPETLPSAPESIEIIEKSPADWVVKAPNLSGGSGVYILQALPAAEQTKVLALARANPRDYAYQRLVKIARIPVANLKGKEYHYENIAADIRMWMFFGNGPTFPLPKLTHNALIRTAPYEKGPMSSTVNTSKGGGYAPMVVVDDIGHPDSIPAEKLLSAQKSLEMHSDLPSFVGAQLIQISEMVSQLREQLSTRTGEAYQTFSAVQDIKRQCREVLSFLHSRNMEAVNGMLETLERKVAKRKVEAFIERRYRRRCVITTALVLLEQRLPVSFFDLLDQMRIFAVDALFESGYSDEDRRHDIESLSHLQAIGIMENLAKEPALKKFLKVLEDLVKERFPGRPLSQASCQKLLFRLEQFSLLAHENLNKSPHTRDFAHLFAADACVPQTYNILFADDQPKIGRKNSNEPCWIATEEEVRTGKLLTESDFIAPELHSARQDWRKVLGEANRLPQNLQTSFLRTAREVHFRKHPNLAHFQSIIDTQPSGQAANSAAISSMLEIMPYAKYNVLQFARMQGLSLADLFSSELKDRRISFLNAEDRSEAGLNSSSFAGECFARKHQAHGLFSDSQIFVWVSSELHPLIQAFTVGHELIHFHQINAMMEREKTSMATGQVAFAGFLNFFGNFLGHASGALEDQSADTFLDRKTIYGLGDAIGSAKGVRTWVTSLRESLFHGASHWNETVSGFGSILGYSLDTCNQDKIRAVREVIPALENAKNIRFMKDLGLEVSLDEARSALPNANTTQVARYRDLLNRAITSPALDWEALRVIANHQLPGIRFERQSSPHDNLKLRAALKPIALAGSYNQTQQQ